MNRNDRIGITRIQAGMGEIHRTPAVHPRELFF